MVGAVFPIAPLQCCTIQVGNIPKHPSSEEIILYKPYQPLYLSLGKGMSGLAELCLKTDCFHKGFVVLLPDRMPLKIPVENNTLHVVCQNILGDTHISKGVNDANEEILLFCTGEELYIPLTAVVTDHGKAGSIVFTAVIVHHLGEAPVHLVGFSRLRGEPTTSASLRSYQLTFGGDEMFMRRNVVLNRCQPAGKSHRLKPFQADRGVGDSFPEQVV